MRWELEQQEKQKVTLRLNGPLTVEHAGELRQALMEALAAAAEVTVELGQELEADLAGLQLLCSAHRSSHAQGKQLLISWVPDSVRQEAEAAGLLQPKGCSLRPHQNCLWNRS